MSPTFKHFWKWVRQHHPQILGLYLSEMIKSCKNCSEVFDSEDGSEFCCEYCYYEYYSPETWVEGREE